MTNNCFGANSIRQHQSNNHLRKRENHSPQPNKDQRRRSQARNGPIQLHAFDIGFDGWSSLRSAKVMLGNDAAHFELTSNNPHNNQSSISDCNQPVSTSTEATSSAILARPNALAMWHTALVRPTWAPIRRESMSKDQRGRIHNNLDETHNNQSE